MNRLLTFMTFILLIAAGWIGLLRISEQKDQRYLQELQSALQTEADEIAEIEAELLEQARHLAEIETSLSSQQADIDSLEASHPDGIPEDLYGTYEQQVAHYNRLVGTYNETLESYARIYSSYSERVNLYNQKVVEANQLAGNLGVTWSINQLAEFVRE